MDSNEKSRDDTEVFSSYTEGFPSYTMLTKVVHHSLSHVHLPFTRNRGAHSRTKLSGETQWGRV